MISHVITNHTHLQIGPADQAGEVIERVSDRLSSSSAQLWVVNYDGKGEGHELPALGPGALHDLCLVLPVTLCEAARHCLVHRCPGSTSDPL